MVQVFTMDAILFIQAHDFLTDQANRIIFEFTVASVTVLVMPALCTVSACTLLLITRSISRPLT